MSVTTASQASQAISMNITIIFALLVGVTVILAIITLLNTRAISKLSKKYSHFLQDPVKGDMTIEELLNVNLGELRAVSEKYALTDRRVGSLETRIEGAFQKMGIVRYNPFEDTGGDLSYAIALLDGENNGFVLNGIYNRGGSYTYAKEIQNGVPARHKLSGEEHEALQMAIGTK